MGEGEVWKRGGVDVWGGPAARTEKGVITIETVKPKEYALAKLVAGITEDNRHGEVDTGEAVGNAG